MKKKIICTLAALAMVMWTSIPAQAEFLGTLFRNNLNVLTLTNNTEAQSMGVTVYYLDDKGIDVVMIEMVPGAQNGNGTTVPLSLPRFGRATKRVIVDVDFSPGARPRSWSTGQALYASATAVVATYQAD